MARTITSEFKSGTLQVRYDKGCMRLRENGKIRLSSQNMILTSHSTDIVTILKQWRASRYRLPAV